MKKFSSINEVWEFLENIPKFQDKGLAASNFGLENIRSFCSEIGDPQNQYPAVHVAGTNGKGTTCHLLESVFRKAGFKTGMFTSPHLIKFNERFIINGREVEDRLILQFFNGYLELINQYKLTFFEISTTLAFWIFKKEKVEIAIIETGLGGRLDSTNIITPVLSIITSIGFDHQDVLGNTIEEIAQEKAGIIKKAVPIILGNIEKKAEKIITKVALENTSQVFRTRELDIEWKKGIVTIDGLEVETQMLEEINKWNIATVFVAVQRLKKLFNLADEVFIEAISSFKSVPGRFEKLSSELNWYFSGAHNKESISSVLASSANLFDKKPIIVLSLMSDKLSVNITELFKEYKVFYHSLDTERAASTKNVAKYLDVEEITESNNKTILNELKTSLVIFTGSFYFYSTVKQWANKI